MGRYSQSQIEIIRRYVQALFVKTNWNVIDQRFKEQCFGKEELNTLQKLIKIRIKTF